MREKTVRLVAIVILAIFVVSAIAIVLTGYSDIVTPLLGEPQ